jgi:hypothetical protein
VAVAMPGAARGRRAPRAQDVAVRARVRMRVHVATVAVGDLLGHPCSVA